MVQINFAQKQVSAKIVYYGPGMSGKTTNLEVVHQRAPDNNKGDLTSISTDGDRTLFFDFMPLDLGTVAGMRTSFQIYTVPGQVYYNSTRKLVLQGVDGVVFVADSSAAMLQENLESLRNLEENLNEYGKSLATTPHVIQFNKRDMPDAMSVEELNQHLNVYGAPYFEAIANTGQGVFPTLKALAARVLESIHSGAQGGAGVPAPRPQMNAPQQSAPRAPMPAPQPQRGLPSGTRTAMEQQPSAPLPQQQQQPVQQPQQFAQQAQPASYAAAAAPQMQQNQVQQNYAGAQPPQQTARTGFHAQPVPLTQSGFHAQQAPVAPQGYNAPQQAPVAPASFQAPRAAAPQQNYQPQAAPQQAPQQLYQPQPMSQPMQAQMQAPMQQMPQPMHGYAEMPPAVAPEMQAPPQQHGYVGAQQPMQPAYPQPAQNYAPPAQAPQLPLQMGGRASAASTPRAKPAAAQQNSAPAARAAGNSASRQVPGPLEGTRFRPRGATSTPRVEPRPTPGEKSSNRLYVGLFVAAAVILAVGLTFVVMSFL